MRAAIGTTAIFLIAIVFVGTAAAADAPAPAPAFEISPFAGYRVGGRFNLFETNQHVNVDDHVSFALALDARADEATQYELFYARQSTRLGARGFAPARIRVECLHIGGTVTLDQSQPHVQPYLAGGLGVARFVPDSAIGHEVTRFSMSLALGLRVPVSRQFLLRVEGRGFVSFMDTNSAIFCRSDESGALCQIRAQGSTFFQFDFLAGASFVF